MELRIKDLHVSVEEKEILRGVNLKIELGKVHALMGPNGAGKSCLANTLMGNPKYIITEGKIFLDGEDITGLAADERAKLGLFLSFQYPSEITGVTMSNFLRTAYNSVKKANVNVLDFHRKLKDRMKELDMDPNFSKRYINEGFSGGEKKRAEILQMVVLEPKYAILDETDSGTDVDALKIIASGINKAKEKTNMGILIITHYNRILQYIDVDKVTIMMNGKIVKEGGEELAQEIEAEGYGKYLNGMKAEEV
ncbi:Fe-S cluster assembly ATPase SufC [Candidatus Woesearchaeota archaeon]|nr:Fe-S cluster assembly ATPase SufC [Candidatus Woesearchaeota archaeon]